MIFSRCTNMAFFFLVQITAEPSANLHEACWNWSILEAERGIWSPKYAPMLECFFKGFWLIYFNFNDCIMGNYFLKHLSGFQDLFQKYWRVQVHSLAAVLSAHHLNCLVWICAGCLWHVLQLNAMSYAKGFTSHLQWVHVWVTTTGCSCKLH